MPTVNETSDTSSIQGTLPPDHRSSLLIIRGICLVLVAIVGVLLGVGAAVVTWLLGTDPATAVITGGATFGGFMALAYGAKTFMLP